LITVLIGFRIKMADEYFNAFYVFLLILIFVAWVSLNATFQIEFHVKKLNVSKDCC